MNSKKHTELPAKRAPGAGRPPSPEGTHVIKKNVSMPPETYEHLLLIGQGKLSTGVRLVTDFHKTNVTKTNNKSRK